MEKQFDEATTGHRHRQILASFAGRWRPFRASITQSRGAHYGRLRTVVCGFKLAPTAP